MVLFSKKPVFFSFWCSLSCPWSEFRCVNGRAHASSCVCARARVRTYSLSQGQLHCLLLLFFYGGLSRGSVQGCISSEKGFYYLETHSAREPPQPLHHLVQCVFFFSFIYILVIWNVWRHEQCYTSRFFNWMEGAFNGLPENIFSFFEVKG